MEQELAKRRGKKIDSSEKEEKDPMDELYVVPEHLKVRELQLGCWITSIVPAYIGH